MFNFERGEVPSHIVLATAASESHVEEIATYLAEYGLIQTAATPSINEWRRGQYFSTFLNDPIVDPVISARFAITYLRTLHGDNQKYDLLLKPIRIAAPSYPGKDTLQTLVILKHGEASINELRGKTP